MLCGSNVDPKEGKQESSLFRPISPKMQAYQSVVLWGWLDPSICVNYNAFI